MSQLFHLDSYQGSQSTFGTSGGISLLSEKTLLHRIERSLKDQIKIYRNLKE